MSLTEYRPIIVCMFLTLVMLKPTSAALIYFDGGAGPNDPNWNNSLNWTFNQIPQAGDYAAIRNNSQVEVTTTGIATGYLDVAGGATLDILSGGLTFGGQNNLWAWVGYQTPGTINQHDGVVTGLSRVDLVVDRYGEYNMLGGQLNIGDDLRIQNGGFMQVAGSSAVTITDDFRSQANSTLEIVLSGTTPPVISADRFVLNNNLTLNIDTTNWQGSEEISLFNADRGFQGGFDAVMVNGYEITDYVVNSNQVTIPVAEPSTLALAISAALGCLFFVPGIRRDRIRKMHSAEVHPDGAVVANPHVRVGASQNVLPVREDTKTVLLRSDNESSTKPPEPARFADRPVRTSSTQHATAKS